MEGYVLAFRPATGEGTIIADSGEAFRFAGANSAEDLSGGDIVRFHVGSADSGNGQASVRDVVLVQKWSYRPTSSQQPTFHELRAALHMEHAVH